MYIPKTFKVTDIKEVVEFIKQNSFGTIVTIENGRPISTHIPLKLRKIEENYYITGHIAYGNSQWKTIEDNEDILLMFQGPHAYVSSSWYAKENVPTWNYQAVHLYGKGYILDKDELVNELAIMINTYEKGRENPVSYEKLSNELLEKQIKGIVGFKVMIKEIQACYKLSQNRSDIEYNNVVEKLRDEGTTNSYLVAEQMIKVKRSNN